MLDALAEFAVARSQFGAARVELPLELGDGPLGIGCRLVERRSHLLAPSGSTLVRSRQMLAALPAAPERDCFVPLAMTTPAMSLRGAERRSNLVEAVMPPPLLLPPAGC